MSQKGPCGGRAVSQGRKQGDAIPRASYGLAGAFRRIGRVAGDLKRPATLALALGACLAAPAGAQTLQGRASVIDGDTIEIQGQRIRLHGIDAPESGQTCQRGGKDWRCGQAAALALSDWLGAGVVACQSVDRDRYGRTVAKCAKSGQDVAGWMVAQGWALDWPRYSGGAYAGAQAAAKAAGRGIWAATFQPPWEWRAGRR